MKVSCIYDQGSAPHREDGLFMADPFFGVLDGVSAPYSPAYPMKKFANGMSGGEFVARTIESFFCNASVTSSLRQALYKASARVGNLQCGHHSSRAILNDAGKLAGATFAIAKIGEKIVEIAQAGDCFTLLQFFDDGILDITKNQVRPHDTEMNAELERLQREVASEKGIVLHEKISEEELAPIRGEVWNRFYETLTAARREDANKPSSRRCYGLLNGQPELFDVMHYEQFSRTGLKTLILFSDGMIPWSVMKESDDEKIARIFLEIYSQGSLKKVLAAARDEEEKIRATHYTSFAEATAIALDFSDES